MVVDRGGHIDGRRKEQRKRCRSGRQWHSGRAMRSSTQGVALADHGRSGVGGGEGGVCVCLGLGRML